MFTGKEFKDYCSSLDIEHITTPAYNPRSNGQANSFVDTFKRTLRKNQGLDTDEPCIQKFLVVFKITPNPNTSSKLSLAELVFARKIRSVFDKLLPRPKKKFPTKVNFNTKIYKPGDKDFFRDYRTGKSYWEDSIV